MVSYWKTQWLRFAIGCLFMLQALYHMFTVHKVAFVAWAVSSLLYFISADLCWHRDCIKDLKKRIEALETRAITDIDKVSENNYMVRRRCGPDKDVPYPKEEAKDDN